VGGYVRKQTSQKETFACPLLSIANRINLMIEKIKFMLAEKVKQNPYLWAILWNTLPKLSFLLPHDRSYYGIRQILPKGQGLILDVGANNGISAVGFMRICPECQVFSIEADIHHKPSLIRLKRKLKRFNFRILAAGQEPGKMTLFTPIYRGIAVHTHTSSSRGYLETSLKRDFSKNVLRKIVFHENAVEVRPLDELNLSPELVKLDIEGKDGEALLGMQKMTQRCRPVFLIEYTPGKMKTAFHFFQKNNYLVYSYDDTIDTFSLFDESREKEAWVECNLQVNLYCCPAEKMETLNLSGIRAA